MKSTERPPTMVSLSRVTVKEGVPDTGVIELEELGVHQDRERTT